MILSNAALASQKHFLNKYTPEEEVKLDDELIIEQFLEEENSAYSLSKITEKGFEIFQKIPGDWFGTNSIS